jgi:hypothetical protein
MEKNLTNPPFPELDISSIKVDYYQMTRIEFSKISMKILSASFLRILLFSVVNFALAPERT